MFFRKKIKGDESLLMSIFNEIIDSYCDFDICFEVGGNHSIIVKDTVEGQVRMARDLPYRDIVLNYASQRVLPEEKESYLKKAELSNIIQKLKENKVYTIYVSEKTPDGRVLKKSLKHTFLEGDERIINVIKTDITEAVAREERANARLAEALQDKEKAMSAQRDFLTRISHEVRTPMNAIIGLADILEEDKNDPVALDKAIKQIKYSGEFLLNIVNDVLDVSRIQQDKFTIRHEKATFADLFEAIDMMIVPMCQQKDITYGYYSDIPADCYVSTDIMRLTQLFINLLSNAVKYTEAGGSINFEARRLSESTEKIACEFKVIDNGIGMSPEFQTHIFEPFKQESRMAGSQVSGTGLGLAIVKGIVDALNGTIDVHSTMGRGTVFTVHLDFDKVAPADVENAAPENFDLTGRRILVVEDNEINREIAATLLQKRNAETFTAENGAVAVDMFQASDEGFYDTVLMDIRMPVLGGFEAAEMIRSLDRSDAKTVRIIAMTADIIDVTEDSPFNEALTKPVNPKLLYSAISK
ncbi:MAG: response regulator [Lachnospiraceae bacterium]|nr:response regulator [Lachnospiraceae bacterium]